MTRERGGRLEIIGLMRVATFAAKASSRIIGLELDKSMPTMTMRAGVGVKATGAAKDAIEKDGNTAPLWMNTPESEPNTASTINKKNVRNFAILTRRR
jgi:hypothetical protein